MAESAGEIRHLFLSELVVYGLSKPGYKIKNKKVTHMTTMKFSRQPLQKSFGSILDEFFNDGPVKWTNGFNGYQAPAVNIHETEEAMHLEVNAPGRNKEDFKISVEDGLLTISYEKKQEHETNTHKTIRREFSYESFKRSFNLGEEINLENIQAKYENGVLRLFLPKKPVVKETAKQINVQ